MDKTNTTNSTLNMIKSVCAERDRKERDRLRANRLAMEQNMDRNRRLLDKGIESVKRERSKTYFSWHLGYIPLYSRYLEFSDGNLPPPT